MLYVVHILQIDGDLKIESLEITVCLEITIALQDRHLRFYVNSKILT